MINGAVFVNVNSANPNETTALPRFLIRMSSYQVNKSSKTNSFSVTVLHRQLFIAASFKKVIEFDTKFSSLTF